MPIENSIDNLAAAINNLAAALSGKSAGTLTQVGAIQYVASMPGEGLGNANKPTKSQPAATAPAATPHTATAQAAVQESKVDSSDDRPTFPSSGGVDFEKQIQKPIVALANGGRRAEAVAILSKFGVKKASEIKPADYPAAVAAILALG